MRFADLVATSDEIGATSSRTEKIGLVADLVARLPRPEIAPGVGFLSGAARQGRIGVGWAAVRSTEVLATPRPELTVGDVDATLSRVAAVGGSGSQAERRTILDGLFARATAAEQDFLGRLLLGELRQGAKEGVMIEGVAAAYDVPVRVVRRALMLNGDLGAVAFTARSEGRAGLEAVRLEVLRPVRPMLASSAEDVATALDRISPAIIERKLDGARVQIHRRGGDIRVFTRSLQNVTGAVPDVVAAVGRIPAQRLVLDGEVIALRPDERPEPFQVTMSRFGGKEADASVPLRLFCFDALHVDGTDLIDEPLHRRLAALDAVVPADMVVPRVRTADRGAAEAFVAATLAAGHEGVLVKDPDAPYAAGRRGAAWLKVKPAHTLDLVVLAVEWGSGRRRGWLSNIHLGARDPAGGWVMLGKTFKGMTDEMLAWQTERFLELETERQGRVVRVRPEQVVEIAFDGVQRSSRYPGGVALRFARVKGYRPDKRPEEANTIDTVRSYLP
jgi:DNA ligase-1